jgi:hypothetical protein
MSQKAMQRIAFGFVLLFWGCIIGTVSCGYPPASKKVEYKFVDSKTIPREGIKDVENYFNKLGEDGWEYVEFTASLYGGSRLFVFKRKSNAT